MKLGQIVLEKLVKNRKVVIRHMDTDDAEPMREYINKISKEQTYITFQGEELSIEDELEHVEKTVKKMDKGTYVKLLLFVDGRLAGISEVGLGVRTHSHVGGLGLSLDSSVRGIGLGKLFLETLLNEVKKELKGLRMIELSVFVNNEIAINLYKSFKFKEVARIPEKIFYKGEYVDEVVMILKV